MTLLALLVSLTLAQAAPARPARPETPTPPRAEVPAQPRPALQPPPPDYMVGAQDVLGVVVFDEPSLSGRFRVDAEGYINFPLVGRIRVAGITVRGIEEQLRKSLADGFLVRPQVTVEVTEFRSQQVFIMGEVRAPGRYTLEGNTSVLEALARAGSVTQDAGDEVLVVHPKIATGTRAALPEDADTEVTRISLRDLQTGKLSRVAIRDGDTIYVTRAETFFVTGQVRSPGSYTLESGMTVLQALSLAGGLTERGTERGIKILRVVEGKKVELDANTEDFVQAGDTIVVGRRLF